MDEYVQKYLLYGLLAVVVIVAAWSVSSLFTQPAGHSPARFQQLEGAKQANATAGQTDPCAPPAGVSAAEWKTHMGHHPDMYPGCV